MALKQTVISAVKSAIPPQVLRQRLNRRGHKVVLLTFDDGPNPQVTPRVLDLLDRWHAKAVFFVLGQRALKAPHLIDEILKRGHQLGNHTFSHLVEADYGRYVDDIQRCQQVLYELTGQYPCLFRPPKGHLNLAKLLAVRHCKLKIIRWSFDTGEYSYLRNAGPKQRAENLIENIKDRAIVLSHDDTEATVEMLEIALPQLLKSGWDLRNGVNCLD